MDPTYAYIAVTGPTIDLDMVLLIVEMTSKRVGVAVDSSFRPLQSTTVRFSVVAYQAHTTVGIVSAHTSKTVVSSTRWAMRRV